MKNPSRKFAVIAALLVVSACSQSHATDETPKSTTPSSDRFGNNTSMGTTTGNDTITDQTLLNQKEGQNSQNIHRRPSSTTAKPGTY